ncbi:hypothetical protein GQX74_004515, partial [Glossina fuscipes]
CNRLRIVYAWSTHCLCIEPYSVYARSMRDLCTTYAPLMHRLAPPIRRLCTVYAPPTHYLYEAYTTPIYRLRIAYVSPIHGLYTAYAWSMRGLCTTYAQLMHRLCPVNASPMHRSYTTDDDSFRQSLVSYKALLSLNVFKSIASGYNRSLQSRKTYHLKSINYSMYSCQITYSINLLVDGKALGLKNVNFLSN